MTVARVANIGSEIAVALQDINARVANVGIEYVILVIPAPTNFALAQGGDFQSVVLTWTDPDIGTNVRVERDVGAGFVELDTVLYGVGTYTDTTYTENTVNTYRLRSYHQVHDQYSDYTSELTIEPPSVPTSLTATATGKTQISLAWTDTASVEDGFEIYRSTDNINFYLLGTVAANAISYDDTGLFPNTTYYYQIRAYNGTVYSPYTSVASDLTDALPAPTGLSISEESSIVDGIILTWTDPVEGTGIIIQRNQDGGSYSDIGEVLLGVETYTDTDVYYGIEYCYRIRTYEEGA